MAAAVVVEGVSKKYWLRHERFRSFQQVAIDFLRGRRAPVEEFWALRDVSFDVAAGETFGIIGANGSGKSTLLKLIARVIQPTSGRITTSGRVAALIELGTGFHPELTGRENVFLHGSFLGLTRREMRARFDRIVAFSELEEKFMDMPLKHYSSGMMMRLGFATAISVDAEVLIIDEVLAVGDVRFQQKCLDALLAFKRDGGTILFVAQDVGTVRRLCDRALLLSHGRPLALGTPAEVVNEYIYHDLAEAAAERAPDQPPDTAAEGVGVSHAEPRPPDAGHSGGAEVTAVRIQDREGQAADRFLSGDPIRIEIEYALESEFARIIPGVQFFGENNEYLYGVAADELAAPSVPGVHRVRLELPSGPFVGGRVRLCVGLADSASEAGYHLVAYRDRGDAFLVLPLTREEGLVRFPLAWSVEAPAEERTLAAPRRSGG